MEGGCCLGDGGCHLQFSAKIQHVISIKKRVASPAFTSPRQRTWRNRRLVGPAPRHGSRLSDGADRGAIKTKRSRGAKRRKQHRGILWRITVASIDTVMQPVILFRHMGNAVTDTTCEPRLTIVWSVG